MGLGSGPCFPLFCLAEQTAPGRQAVSQAGRQAGRQGRGRGEARIEGSAQGTGALSPQQAGWPGRMGYRGSPFFFVLCRQNGGSCCCLGASARPRVRLYRIPSLSTSSLPPLVSHTQNRRHSLSLSLSHTSPSIHLQFQISWGCAVFCRCPGERADVQPEEERTFIVSVARQKALFIATKEIPVSECVCVNNCLKEKGIGLG